MFARVALAVVLSAAVVFAQGRPRKIFISVDMEGISGVVQPAQLGPDGFEYQRAREWMTGEVNAAINGIRDSGPAEIVVCDSHGNGQSLLIDKVPDDVRIVRGFPEPAPRSRLACGSSREGVKPHRQECLCHNAILNYEITN